jgi:Phage integrase family
VLRVWQHERAGNPDDPLFPTSRGSRLSRDAVAWLLTKHVATAAHACPSLGAKTISPHTLRHTAAMRLLHAGVDITVIALWLGHESTQTTQIYLHADLALKQRALARTAPPRPTPPPDATGPPTNCSPSWNRCDQPSRSPLPTQAEQALERARRSRAGRSRRPALLLRSGRNRQSRAAGCEAAAHCALGSTPARSPVSVVRR